MALALRPLLIAFATPLALGACSPGEEGAGSRGGASQVSAEASASALSAFGLGEDSRARWDSMEQDGVRFTFEGFVLEDLENTLRAQTLVLEGPQVTQEGPVFDRFSMTAGEITTVEDNTVTRFGALEILDGGPDIAEALAAALQGRDAAIEGDDAMMGRFESIRIERLSVEGQSETGQPLSVTLAEFAAGPHDGETIGAMRLEGLAVDTRGEDGTPVTLTLRAAQIEGLAAGMVSILNPDLAAAASAPGTLSFSGQYERFAVDDLQVAAGGIDIAMPRLEGEIEPGSGGGFISRASMDRMTLTADPQGGEQGAQIAEALSGLGYDAMVFSFESEATYDAETDRMATQGENYLRLEDGFTLRFEQAMTGLEAYTTAYADWLANGGSADGAPPENVLDAMRVERFVIALEDDSLLDRSLAMVAAMQGATPEQVRAQAGAYVALGAAFAGDAVPPVLLRQLQAALTGFIGQGGALVVEINPEPPVSMAAISQAVEEGRVQDLGLSVSHEAP